MDTNKDGGRTRSGIPCVIHNLLVGFYEGDTRYQQLLCGEAADDGGEKEKLIPLLLTLGLLPHRVHCETGSGKQK